MQSLDRETEGAVSTRRGRSRRSLSLGDRAAHGENGLRFSKRHGRVTLIQRESSLSQPRQQHFPTTVARGFNVDFAIKIVSPLYISLDRLSGSVTSDASERHAMANNRVKDNGTRLNKRIVTRDILKDSVQPKEQSLESIFKDRRIWKVYARTVIR